MHDSVLNLISQKNLLTPGNIGWKLMLDICTDLILLLYNQRLTRGCYQSTDEKLLMKRLFWTNLCDLKQTPFLCHIYLHCNIDSNLDWKCGLFFVLFFPKKMFCNGGGVWVEGKAVKSHFQKETNFFNY